MGQGLNTEKEDCSPEFEMKISVRPDEVFFSLKKKKPA